MLHPLGFPAPFLTLSEPNVPEGKMVTVTCAAGARALVTLDGVPAVVPGQPAQLQLNATVNDDRRGFFCDATLEVDGEILSKNESTELRVLCELSSRLPPRDLQGPAQSLAVSWKWSLSHGPRVAFSIPHPCPQTLPGWTIQTVPGAGRGRRAQSRHCVARPMEIQRPLCTAPGLTAEPCWRWACWVPSLAHSPALTAALRPMPRARRSRTLH